MKKKQDVDIDKFFSRRIDSLPPEIHNEDSIQKSVNLLIEHNRKIYQKNNYSRRILPTKIMKVLSGITDFFRNNRIWILKPQPLLGMFSVVLIAAISIILLTKENPEEKPVLASYGKKQHNLADTNQTQVKQYNNDLAYVDKIEMTRLEGHEYGNIYMDQLIRGYDNVIDTSAIRKDSLKLKAYEKIKTVLASKRLKYKDSNNKIVTQWDYSGPVKEGKLYKSRMIFGFSSNEPVDNIKVKYYKYLSNEKKIPSKSIIETENKYDDIYDEIKSRLKK
jgi:hypothetical protein